MGNRAITGKISLYLFGMVNMLMLLGPVLLPAYRGFIKIQYARIWRNRLLNRRGRENTDFRISKADFEKYREGRHEIWLGNKLYDIESINILKDSVDLQLDYDQDETHDLTVIKAIQQTIPANQQQKDIAGRWLHWLSELVIIHLPSKLPVKTKLVTAMLWPVYSSATLHGYPPVSQKPPDGQLIS